MAAKRKTNMMLCKKAAIILNHDLESYRRGRMAFEDFRSRLDMAKDLNISVVCEKTGRTIDAIQQKSGRRTTIDERKCSCKLPRKKAKGRK
jgi:hypothetical protein